MPQISQDDVERIAEALAPRLVEQVKASRHDFWIDPEEHYKEHMAWRELNPEEIHTVKDMVALFRTTRGLFLKAFIGCAVIGAIFLAAIGLSK